MKDLSCSPKFAPKNVIDSITRFKDKFRKTLMGIGKSPDAHVYDLNQESLWFVKSEKDRKFLFSVVRFYNDLSDDLDKKIFLTEVLERGRHYPFWHYGLLETPDYRQRLASIYKKLDAKFHLEALA